MGSLCLFLVCLVIVKEVSQLNHQTTILSDQLPALRQGTQALSEGLSRIKSEVITKQQELEEDLRRRETSVREGIDKMRQDLKVQV